MAKRHSNSCSITQSKRAKWFVFAFLIFPVVQFFVFFIFVNFKSITMAFSDSKGIIDFGSSNWKYFLNEWASQSRDIQISLKNSVVYFVVCNFINLPLVIIFSYFLFKKCFGHKVFRVIFFLPSIIGTVVFCKLFSFFVGNIQGEMGICLKAVKFFYELFGADLPENIVSQGLLGDSSTAFGTIMAETLWTGMGLSMVLISGGLARLPEGIFEAGKIDGVSLWREFFSLVLPLLMPTIASVFTLNMAGVFTFYQPVMLLTEGAFDTSTIGWYITRFTLDRAKKSGDGLNYPAFIGVLTTVVAVPFVFIVRKIMDLFTPDVSY